MIDCEKCNLPNKDDSLYCEHCGERLSTKACRRCKTYVPPKVKYCTKCGYPAEGAVCEKCGKVNPDDAAFCSVCGNKLGGAVATAQSQDYAQPQTAEAAKEKKPAASGKAMYAYRIARSFTVSALLMCMFVFSFFGAFSKETITGIDTNISESSMSFEIEMSDATVTGFDAVRGMFLLISPPTLKEVQRDFKDFAKTNGYIGSSGRLDNPEKAMREFGVLRMAIYDENMCVSLVMQVLMWGLHSLAIMITTLVFFILSLIRAFQITLKKTDKFGNDALALSLGVALSLGFAVTGGFLGAGTILNIIFGCLGLSGIITSRYVIEKAGRGSALAYVRRSVCAVLALLIMCFAGSSIVKIGYAKTFTDDGEQLAVYPDFKAGVPIDELIAGMDNPLEKNEILKILSGQAQGLTAEKLDMLAALICTDEMAEFMTEKDRILFLRVIGSPVLMSYMPEAIRSYEPGIKATSWLTYFAFLFIAAMSVIYMCKMLAEEAEPEKKHKTTLWSVLTMVGTIAMLVMGIIYAVTGYTISHSLNFGLTYSVGALPIVSAVLGIGLFVVDLVLHKCDKKKA